MPMRPGCILLHSVQTMKNKLFDIHWLIYLYRDSFHQKPGESRYDANFVIIGGTEVVRSTSCATSNTQLASVFSFELRDWPQRWQHVLFSVNPEVGSPFLVHAARKCRPGSSQRNNLVVIHDLLWYPGPRCPGVYGCHHEGYTQQQGSHQSWHSR